MADSTFWNQNRGKRAFSGAAITARGNDRERAAREIQGQIFGGIPDSSDKDLIAMFKRYGKYLYQPTASRMAFNANLEGDYQQTLKTLLGRLQNTNYARKADQAGNRFQQSYAKFSAQADQQARSMGLGEGARAAASKGLSQQAARGAAAARETWLDPSRKTGDLMQALQLLSQSMEANPYLLQQLQLHSPIEENRKARLSERQPSMLGGIAGGLLNAGARYAAGQIFPTGP